MKRYFFTVFFVLIASLVSSQRLKLVIDDTRPVEELVKSLEGKGVEISNITHNLLNTVERPVAYFDDFIGLLGVSDGLVMTTGTAKGVEGPNDQAAFSSSTGNALIIDPDLETIIGRNQFDVVVIEFDLVGSLNELSFTYVFGSEEYTEFVGEFNDGFGFFISGPGINGTQNLAVLPNGDPVSVNSINNATNNNQYVNNGSGSTPASDFYMQYDGYTKPLKARIGIVPCEKYHIKLVIGDNNDGAVDSGVFIERGSFTSTSFPSVSVEYESERFDVALEGCSDGYFIISRPEGFGIENPFSVFYQLSGTAINSVDYETLSNNITIPIGQNSDTVTVSAIQDFEEETREQVILNIVNQCLDSPSVATGVIEIEDEFLYEIEPVSICKGDSALLNNPFDRSFHFNWIVDTLLSCTNCGSPFASPIASDTFDVLITDTTSGCETKSNAIVKVVDVKAFFTYKRRTNYSSLDAFFINQSEQAQFFNWEFGDGAIGTDENPTHTYSIPDEPRTLTFNVKLEAISKEGCSDTYDTIIAIETPLFIPNIISPNDDGLNDDFLIRGIENGNWKMRIYNRWGAIIYETENYVGNWSPKNEKINGMYYYELENLFGDRNYKGWLQVVR